MSGKYALKSNKMCAADLREANGNGPNNGAAARSASARPETCHGQLNHSLENPSTSSADRPLPSPPNPADPEPQKPHRRSPAESKQTAPPQSRPTLSAFTFIPNTDTLSLSSPALTADNARLRAALVSTQAHIGRLERVTIEPLRQRLADAERDRQSLQRDFVAMQAAVESGRNTHLQHQRKLRDALVELEKLVVTSEDNSGGREGRWTTTDEVVTSVSEAFKKLRERNDDLMQKDRLHQTAAAAAQDLEIRLRSRCEEVEKERDSLQSVIQRDRATLIASQKESSELNALLSGTVQRAAMTEYHRQALQLAQTQLQGEKDEATRRMKKSDGDLATMHSAYCALHRRHTELTTTYNALLQQLELSKKAEKESRESSVASNHNLDALNARYHALSEQLSQTKAACSESAERAAKAEEERDRLKVDWEAARAAFNEKEVQWERHDRSLHEGLAEAQRKYERLLDDHRRLSDVYVEKVHFACEAENQVRRLGTMLEEAIQKEQERDPPACRSDDGRSRHTTPRAALESMHSSTVSAVLVSENAAWSKLSTLLRQAKLVIQDLSLSSKDDSSTTEPSSRLEYVQPRIPINTSPPSSSRPISSASPATGTVKRGLGDILSEITQICSSRGAFLHALTSSPPLYTDTLIGKSEAQLLAAAHSLSKDFSVNPMPTACSVESSSHVKREGDDESSISLGHVKEERSDEMDAIPLLNNPSISEGAGLEIDPTRSVSRPAAENIERSTTASQPPNASHLPPRQKRTRFNHVLSADAEGSQMPQVAPPPRTKRRRINH